MLNKLFFLFFILVLFLIVPQQLFSQESATESDSAVLSLSLPDSARLFSDEPVKSPRGAMLRSLVLPGWGQYYNESYLKAGIAFGTASFLVYHINWYQYKWNETKLQDFRNKRNLYSWYTLLAYLLTMADAYVDASLYKFDESMELSHQMKQLEGEWVVSAGLTFHF